METMNVSDENELRRIIHTENLQHYIDYTDYKTEPLTLNIVLATDQMVERDVSNDQIIFKREDIEKFEKKHSEPGKDQGIAVTDDRLLNSKIDKRKKPAETSGPKVGSKRKRRYHEPYNEITAVAEQLFKDNPGIKTADVIRHEKVREIQQKYNLTRFTEKTIRGWIQDLNPNYKPKTKQ